MKLWYKDEVIAANINIGEPPISQISKMIDIGGELLFFEKVTDIFTYNDKFLNFDFEILT